MGIDQRKKGAGNFFFIFYNFLRLFSLSVIFTSMIHLMGLLCPLCNLQVDVNKGKLQV